MATISSAQQGGKYTQGFVFEHGSINNEYARAVVERSCAAAVSLLQDVFALAEKNIVLETLEIGSIQEQNRAFRQLASVIRCRPQVEKSLVTAVACAYAEIANAGTVTAQNAVEIAQRIADLEQHRREKLDLVSLFEANTLRDQITDRVRPLLLDLNMQLSALFTPGSKNIVCNPLSPATLISGFIAGLICAEMDILAKQRLYRAFEQEFLSKLSVLLNSVILRLEQENAFAKRAVSFNDKNAGPIERLLHSPVLLTLPELQQVVDKMHHTLSTHQAFNVAQRLYELSGEDSLDSVITLCGDLQYYHDKLLPEVLRDVTLQDQSAELVETRRVISEHLNTSLSGKYLPLAVKDFLGSLWSDVLFAILVNAGRSSALWHEAMQLQDALVESVTPIHDAEKLMSLNSVIVSVVKSLRKMLDESGCRFYDKAAFLAELKLLHLQNMQQQMKSDCFFLWENVSVQPAVVESLLDDDEIVCYQQMKTMLAVLSCKVSE